MPIRWGRIRHPPADRTERHRSCNKRSGAAEERPGQESTMSQLQIQAPSAAEAPAVDRRRGVRKQADLRIRVLLAEKGLGTAGHTVNISRHGALVRTFAPL